MAKHLHHAKVRRTLYEWHGGDCLYAAASSGLVADIPALQSALRANALWCDRNARSQRDCAHDARYLRSIADWLPEACEREGIMKLSGRLYHLLPWA